MINSQKLSYPHLLTGWYFVFDEVHKLVSILCPFKYLLIKVTIAFFTLRFVPYVSSRWSATSLYPFSGTVVVGPNPNGSFLVLVSSGQSS